MSIDDLTHVLSLCVFYIVVVGVFLFMTHVCIYLYLSIIVKYIREITASTSLVVIHIIMMPS